MKRTILIASDDAKARNSLQQILELDGLDVVQAESGEQTLALATAVHIDIFLLAVEMPGMNGVRLCKEFREIERYRETPIILLTGESGDNLLQQALTLGANDFVQKPYTPITVRARLKIHVQRL